MKQGLEPQHMQQQKCSCLCEDDQSQRLRRKHRAMTWLREKRKSALRSTIATGEFYVYPFC